MKLRRRGWLGSLTGGRWGRGSIRELRSRVLGSYYRVLRSPGAGISPRPTTGRVGLVVRVARPVLVHVVVSWGKETSRRIWRIIYEILRLNLVCVWTTCPMGPEIGAAYKNKIRKTDENRYPSINQLSYTLTKNNRVLPISSQSSLLR